MKRKGESPFSFAVSMAVLIFFVFAFKQSILDANNIPSGSMIPTLKIGDYLFVNKMRYSLRIPFTEFEVARIDDPRRGDVITFIPPTDPEKHYVKRVMGIPGDRIRIRSAPACELSFRYQLPEQKIKRAYSCDPNSPRSALEPVIAFVDYKEDDKGPWKSYRPRELSDDESRAILMDSDNTVVLAPDLNPRNENRLPVLFAEDLPNNGTHLMVESSFVPRANELCEDIDTTGCLIPTNQYLVMGDNRDDSQDSRFIGLISREKILGKVAIIYFSINWRDEICEAFAGEYMNLPPESGEGYRLPDFPPEKQRRYCSRLDGQARNESLAGYLKRTFLYRIWRMSVRWGRIGNLLK